MSGCNWLPASALRVAVEVGRIASAPGTAEQRVRAMLEPLRRLVPFEAACIFLLDESWTRPASLVSVGYDDAVRRYIDSVEYMAEIELLGYNRTRGAIRVRDAPVPREQIRSWTEFLSPAGFREGMVVGLFSPDGRFLGGLGLNTDDREHPTEAARDLVAMLAPMIANAVDPLRSVVETVRMVRDAVAGTVLTVGGTAQPLPGLPSHPILAPGSVALTAASRLASESVHGSFACPHAEGHLRLTVLACPRGHAGQWAAAVVVSPPGDMHGLTHREMQVAGLLIEGWPNPRIASALFIAERTVATHVEHILAKLGAASRTLAAARALRSGAYIPRLVTIVDDEG